MNTSNIIILNILLLIFVIYLIYLIYLIFKFRKYQKGKVLRFSNTQIIDTNYILITNKVNIKLCKKLFKPYPSIYDTYKEINTLLDYQILRNEHKNNIKKEAFMTQKKILNFIVKNIRFNEKTHIFNYYNSIVEPCIYWLKIYYDRVRPYYLNNNLKNNSITIPSHPSYPSAHATTSYFFAYCNNYINGNKKCFKKAYYIAIRREIAGMHYPSDTTYGIFIAGELFKLWKEDYNLIFKNNPIQH